MRPTVVFSRVMGDPAYQLGAERWLESYRRHLTHIPHDLVIINNRGEGDSMFAEVGGRNLTYAGGGWDCGAWKFAAREIKAPLLVCFNSSTRILGGKWLERFVEAASRHGDGIYGPLASYENNPHLRTPCLAFQPRVMNEYPREVLDREDTYRFESLTYPDGTPNLTMWAKKKRYATMMVTWSGVFKMGDWRSQKNIFRNGDQSDLIVRDRHCDAYDASDEVGKKTLAKMADGDRVLVAGQ